MVKISLVQFNPGWDKPIANRARIKEITLGLKTDILVLPELCISGYSFINRQEALNYADRDEQESLLFFKNLAQETQAVVIAGYVEKSGNQVFNASYMVFPDGNYRHYRKTHLFFREKECFDPGNSGFFGVEHPIVDCRMGMMICNDWRFPEAARSLALSGVDIIICPSNLVSELWKIGMPSRALENKVFLAVCNRHGTESRDLDNGQSQNLTFNGGSVPYDFYGTPLIQAGKNEDQVISYEIDPKLTRDKTFNAYNDLLKDRCPEFYL